MDDLFAGQEASGKADRPLADCLRPACFADVAGQPHITGDGSAVLRMARSGRLSSMILWGPPGSGKTTIARLLLAASGPETEELSATSSGTRDLKKVFDKARLLSSRGKGLVLFVDEIHRFNRSRQDEFLPHVESGAVILIGATTANPSFALDAALLSRMQTVILNGLDDSALEALLGRVEKYKGRKLPLTDSARALLCRMAGGDGRHLVNLAEQLFLFPADCPVIGPENLAGTIHGRLPVYDRQGECHYNLASALQKSVRGSDVDAALYWAARMLDGGEDPLFIIRRLIVTASEDVGNADPQALVLAVAARDAYEFLGRPEGEIAIGQLVAYLATAPKSNRSHIAFKKAKVAAKKTAALPPPAHALNPVTGLMKSAGYGEGYIYDHDTDDAFAGLDYFPARMERQAFYQPSSSGFDREIAKRLAYWNARRQKKAPE